MGTRDQRKPADKLKHFNQIYVYFPLGLMTTLFCIILGLLFAKNIYNLGGADNSFVMTSGMADMVFILISLPLIFIIMLFPIIFLTLLIYKGYLQTGSSGKVHNAFSWLGDFNLKINNYVNKKATLLIFITIKIATKLIYLDRCFIDDKKFINNKE